MTHFIETTVDSHYCQNPNNKKTAQCQLILDSNNNVIKKAVNVLYDNLIAH